LAIGGFLVWENRRKPPAERHLLRDEASLFAPFTLVVGLACAYVIWNVGLSNFYSYIIRFPFLYYRSGDANNWATSFDDLAPTVRGVFQWTTIKLVVPGVPLAYAVYFWRSVKRRGETPPPEATLLAAVAFSLFLTIAYAPQHVRVAGVSLPAFVLAIWMLNRMALPAWKVPAWAFVGAFVILATLHTQQQHYFYYDTPAGHLAMEDRSLYSELAWLDKRTDPGDLLFDANDPTLYVLLGLQNPARVPFVEPDDYTRPHQVAVTVRRLREEQPRYVIWPFEPDDSDDPHDRLFPLGKELRRNYQAVRMLRDGEVWERKGPVQESEFRSQNPEPSQ
jgi:hypothetical protein